MDLVILSLLWIGQDSENLIYWQSYAGIKKYKTWDKTFLHHTGMEELGNNETFFLLLTAIQPLGFDSCNLPQKKDKKPIKPWAIVHKDIESIHSAAPLVLKIRCSHCESFVRKRFIHYSFKIVLLKTSRTFSDNALVYRFPALYR